MSRLLELIDELKTDLSLEAGEAKDWGLHETITTTIQRLEEIRSQAVKSGGEGHVVSNRIDLHTVAQGRDE